MNFQPLVGVVRAWSGWPEEKCNTMYDSLHTIIFKMCGWKFLYLAWSMSYSVLTTPTSFLTIFCSFSKCAKTKLISSTYISVLWSPFLFLTVSWSRVENVWMKIRGPLPGPRFVSTYKEIFFWKIVLLLAQLLQLLPRNAALWEKQTWLSWLRNCTACQLWEAMPTRTFGF